MSSARHGKEWKELIHGPPPLLGQSVDDWLFSHEYEACRREREKKNGNSEPLRRCECRELLDVNGRRRPAPKFHSCEYVRLRDSLIPAAVEIATRKIGVPTHGGLTTLGNKWTAAFVKALDELVVRNGTHSNGSNGEAPKISTSPVRQPLGQIRDSALKFAL
jgi:hypothetical protein